MSGRRGLSPHDFTLAVPGPNYNSDLSAMYAKYGDRCDEFEPLCVCCIGWELFDRYGRMPTEQEVSGLMRWRQQRELESMG